MTASWMTNRFSPRLLWRLGGERDTLAAPMPIRMYRTVHTTGNTHPGGERGGFVMAVAYSAIPFRDSQPDSAPAPRLNRLQNT